MRLGQTLPSTQSDGLGRVDLIILGLFDDGSRVSFWNVALYQLTSPCRHQIHVTHMTYPRHKRFRSIKKLLQFQLCSRCPACMLHRKVVMSKDQMNLTIIAGNTSLTLGNCVARVNQSRHECPRNNVHTCLQQKFKNVLRNMLLVGLFLDGRTAETCKCNV